jgi:hypothetical protein
MAWAVKYDFESDMMAYDNSKLYNITPGAHQKNHG